MKPTKKATKTAFSKKKAVKKAPVKKAAVKKTAAKKKAAKKTEPDSLSKLGRDLLKAANATKNYGKSTVTSGPASKPLSRTLKYGISRLKKDGIFERAAKLLPAAVAGAEDKADQAVKGAQSKAGKALSNLDPETAGKVVGAGLKAKSRFDGLMGKGPKP